MRLDTADQLTKLNCLLIGVRVVDDDGFLVILNLLTDELDDCLLVYLLSTEALSSYLACFLRYLNAFCLEIHPVIQLCLNKLFNFDDFELVSISNYFGNLMFSCKL
jgi:hypothetical protein